MIEFFMLFTSHMFYPIRKEILFTYIFIFVHSMSFYHNSKKKKIFQPETKGLNGAIMS